MANLLKEVESSDTGVKDIKNDSSTISHIVDLHSTSINYLEHQIS